MEMGFQVLYWRGDKILMNVLIVFTVLKNQDDFSRKTAEEIDKRSGAFRTIWNYIRPNL